MKGKVDRYFAHLDRRISDARLGRVVRGMKHIHDILSSRANECYDGMEEIFFPFWPGNDRAEWVRDHVLLDPKSLPCPVRSSNYMTYKCVDNRRHHMLGQDALTVTGVECRSHGLPGFNAHGALTQCRIKPFIGPIYQTTDPHEDVPAAAAQTSGDSSSDESDEGSTSEDDSAVEVDVEEVPQVSQGQKTYRGWKLSYRQKKPEQKMKQKALKRCAQRNKAFAHLDPCLPAAGRHMETPGVDLQRKKESRQARQAADADFRKRFKEAAEEAQEEAEEEEEEAENVGG